MAGQGGPEAGGISGPLGAGVSAVSGARVQFDRSQEYAKQPAYSAGPIKHLSSKSPVRGMAATRANAADVRRFSAQDRRGEQVSPDRLELRQPRWMSSTAITYSIAARAGGDGGNRHWDKRAGQQITSM